MSGKDVVKLAKKLVGKPFLMNGASPKGFDCSGLVVYCYKQAVNKNLPHSTKELLKEGKEVKKAQLKEGDLIFPESTYVGIYAGNNLIIYACSTKNQVIIREMFGFYTGRRILNK